MTSSVRDTRCYVWIWLPGAVEPVVAGRLSQRQGEAARFIYGRSYLDRPDAISLYTPELPLRPGIHDSPDGLTMPGCIADAGPDSWGQRVILYQLTGKPLTADSETADLPPISYLVESGSDRIGALDFQRSADAYEPRGQSATLEQMARAADMLDAGEELSPELGLALLHGSSIGGARPKALLDDGDRRLIAKFASRYDRRPVVRSEALGMELARRVGLDVARTELTECLGNDVLLVDRFDRTGVPGARRQIVSALTMLGLDEMAARWGTYPDLANLIRSDFTDPAATLRELFGRIVLNILIGNTDDHARNHAAFWDGAMLTLTPAYDLCPQPRAGTEANQALAIGRDGQRESRLQVCREAAGAYALTTAEADEIIDRQVTTITDEWDDAADAARLTREERSQLRGRQILNPYAFQTS
jgi:serine/threonine-protein kinase HipA